MAKWKPTAAEVKAIKAAAAREGSMGVSAVILEPGYRRNLKEDRPYTLNIALVSDDPTWDDTDLDSYGEWKDFRSGVELTEDGRAIVDFYIRRRLPPRHPDYGCDYLEGNVTVEYAGGRVTRIYGYGESGNYPLP